MPAVNHQFRLAARPVGLPKDSDWSYVEEPVGEPGEGEVLVKVRYVSLDPAMRGWMNEGRSYIPPVGIGEVMRAFAAGEVVASNAPNVAVGEHVGGLLGVQEYAVANGAGVFKLDPAVAPLPVYLGTLGMPGVTAYFGLLDVGRPQEGETVVVSGAAGAVGSLVGQIAKINGCRVVGIAGGHEKGIDVYFDNVGGEILDAALAQLARHARVVICGAISQYNAGQMRGPSNYMSLLVNHASMTGFVMSDYLDRYGEAVTELARWLAAGQLISREDVAQGLESFPQTLLRLFSGEHIGKLVLELAA